MKPPCLEIFSLFAIPNVLRSVFLGPIPGVSFWPLNLHCFPGHSCGVFFWCCSIYSNSGGVFPGHLCGVYFWCCSIYGISGGVFPGHLCGADGGIISDLLPPWLRTLGGTSDKVDTSSFIIVTLIPGGRGTLIWKRKKEEKRRQ